ncbi:MAG: UPF0149 family protein [Opitutaceae bacterium]|nr:UPF0149 family protein [Opitutaceae bacterium]
MTRYEAHVEKNWQEHGLAHLLVARFRDDGSADYAMFLVDLLCLGVKDVFSEFDLTADDVRATVIERLPEELREAIHPACAKKMIEGAVAYAQSFGFAPHRDFRKARKILSGLDASACPTEFTYGEDGKPCYVRGSDDDDDRVDRILGRLEARCGADGFHYVDPMEDAADDLAVRDKLLEFLEAEAENVPRFYEVSGLITGMLICPTVIAPPKLADVLWGPKGRTWKNENEAQTFFTLLMDYWNQVSNLVHDALPADTPPETQIMDVWSEDFDDQPESGLAMTLASVAWAKGFLRATTFWPEAWGDALTRPDLAPHWEVVGWWAGFENPKNRDRVIAEAKAKSSRTLNSSVIALARALRSNAPA